MAATGTAAVANEVKPDYQNDYLIAAQGRCEFDQFTLPRGTGESQPGISVNFPIVESQQPATSTLDELADVNPVSMRINEVVVTLQEFGNAIQVTRFAKDTAYANLYSQAAEINGYNYAESIDFIVRAVAGQGSRSLIVAGLSARSGIQGIQTAGHRISGAFLIRLMAFARTIKMPMFEDNALVCIMHPYVQYDLLQDSTIVGMSQYAVKDLLFNAEIGYWGGMRIIVSANAKVWWGAGGVASSTISTTLAANANVGDTNIKVASVTNFAAQQFATIQDNAETGNTWSDTNEGFFIQTVGTSGAGGTGLTGFVADPGPGDGGGLRYAHASGITVSNNNSAFPICLLGPSSITKAYCEDTGPYGETTVTGPFDVLGRFLNLGWYGILGFARTRNGWIFRGEVGSSQA